MLRRHEAALKLVYEHNASLSTAREFSNDRDAKCMVGLPEWRVFLKRAPPQWLEPVRPLIHALPYGLPVACPTACL